MTTKQSITAPAEPEEDDSVINLDDEAATRTSKAPTVVFKGVKFSLPSELPFEVFLHLGHIQASPATALVAMDELMAALFGDRREEFLALKPSLQDVKTMMESLTDTYGISLGEA